VACADLYLDHSPVPVERCTAWTWFPSADKSFLATAFPIKRRQNQFVAPDSISHHRTITITLPQIDDFANQGCELSQVSLIFCLPGLDFCLCILITRPLEYPALVMGAD
jgi:hypothetical protein